MRKSYGTLLTSIVDVNGNVLPMAAAGIFVAAALVGGGVDMSRAYRAETRLQSACDAGVLAGRRAVTTNGFDATAEAQAEAFFATNFDNSALETRNTAFVASSTDEGNTVNGVATANLDTAIMSIFGYEQFDLAVNCRASMGVGNSDVMMVLDTTGSMLDEANGTEPEAGDTTKLQDLQGAMKNFYDTVAAATGGSNSRVRYGFVPFSSSVNVGKLIYATNPNYLVDTYQIQSRQWFAWEDTPETSSGTGYTSTLYDRNWTRISTTSYNTEENCLDIEPEDTAWTNHGSGDTGGDVDTYINSEGQKVVRTTTSTQPQRSTVYECRYRSSNNKWYVNWKYAYRDLEEYDYEISDPIYQTGDDDADVDGLMYRRVEYDVSEYIEGNSVSILIGEDDDNRPEWVSSTWEGCIEERSTVSDSTFAFVAGTGITPAGATDLDIDSAPDTGDDATKWAPMWPELAYYRTTGSAYSLSGTKASSSCPHEAQLFAEMDEDEFDEYADSLVARGNTYHDLGMIWGGRFSSPDGAWQSNVNDDPSNGGAVSRHLIYMTDGILQPSSSIQSSYGIERNDWRVTDDGSSNLTSRHRSRFLALCEAVKAKGIRVWVIAFGTALTADLQTCSSPSSSFTATDATSLNTAFQEIANQVGELRVTL